MKWFKKKEPIDPLETAKSRDEIIERLEEKGYFVRPKKIRKPKIGDIVIFHVGAGWKLNTHYYQTGTVVKFDDYGNITVEKRKKDGALIATHTVRALEVVKVTKPKIERKNKS